MTTATAGARSAATGTPRPSPPDPRPRPFDPNEGHRVHLRALIRQERSAAYRRVDYLSPEWQMALWRDQVKDTLQGQEARQSPSSVAGTAFHDGVPDFDCGASLDRGADHRGYLRPRASGGESHHGLPAGPSEICVRWRDKIVEWKYQVIDRLGE